jgi:hypothetical protein
MRMWHRNDLAAFDAREVVRVAGVDGKIVRDCDSGDHASYTRACVLRPARRSAAATRHAPTQFREMIRQTTATVELPAGTSTITLAKNHPDYPGETQPGTVDLDYVDVELLP